MVPAPLAESFAEKGGPVNASTCHPYVPGYTIENKTTSRIYSLTFIEESWARTRRQTRAEWVMKDAERYIEAIGNSRWLTCEGFCPSSVW